MTFAERWSGEEPLRGIVVRLPAASVDLIGAAVALDFVAVDLVAGPSDELSFSKLAVVAKAARLGLVAIANPPAQRLTALGADLVLAPDDPTLRVVDDLDGIRDDLPRVALDVTAHLMRMFAALAGTPAVSALPLVLLPGMLGSARMFSDVVSELDGAIRCHPMRVDLDESVVDAAESVLAAAPPRFALAGHSLGGIVALEVCRRAPRRVTRLVLLNSSARPPTDAQLLVWTAIRERIEAGEFDAVVAEQATVNVGIERPDLEAAWIELAGQVGPEGFLRQLSMQASRSDYRPHLDELDVPTLVLSGSQDAVCPVEIQVELAAAISRAEHVIIDGAGHMLPMDHPVEVAAALRTWFVET